MAPSNRNENTGSELMKHIPDIGRALLIGAIFYTASSLQTLNTTATGLQVEIAGIKNRLERYEQLSITRAEFNARLDAIQARLEGKMDGKMDVKR